MAVFTPAVTFSRISIEQKNVSHTGSLAPMDDLNTFERGGSACAEMTGNKMSHPC